MRTTIIISTIVCLFTGAVALGQGGNPTNFSTNGSFLGWDGSGFSQPLNIRNNFNRDINILRNGLNRMQFQTENWTGLNGAF
jgi:hypothetical protein